jgi:hypothetical protein
VKGHLGGRLVGESLDDRLVEQEPVAGMGPAILEDLVAGDQAGPGGEPAAIAEVAELPSGDKAHLLHYLVDILQPRQARPHERPQFRLKPGKEPQKGFVEFVRHPITEKRPSSWGWGGDQPTLSLPEARKTHGAENRH